MWYVDTAPHCGRVVIVSDRWSLYINPTGRNEPIGAPGIAGNYVCGGSEAVAFRTLDDDRHVPALRIRRSVVWNLLPDEPVAEIGTLAGELEEELENQLRARGKARTLCRYRPQVRRLTLPEPRT